MAIFLAERCDVARLLARRALLFSRELETAAQSAR
jgi:hypothetical protein